MKNSLPTKAKRAVELATEKGWSNWLTVFPLKELDYNLNKKEFRDAFKLRYEWEITDTPMICACGVQFSVDHAMVCQRGGFIIQRHNELRHLEAEMLRMVCNDVEVELVLQEVTGETLNHGANKAPDARLDIHARGFWERQRSAFFDVRVCHPNADSYRLFLSKSTRSVRTRRRGSMQKESWRSNRERSLPQFSRPQVEWRMSLLCTTVDLRSWSQIRREKVTQGQFPG